MPESLPQKPPKSPFSQLFTNRQLTALTTFSALVGEAQRKAESDAVAAGLADDGVGLADGGTGARAYGEAIGVYLAFVIDQLTNQCSSICGWNAPNTQMRTVFARQAIPMTWDYAESNPFSNSSGCFDNVFNLELQAFEGLVGRHAIPESRGSKMLRATTVCAVSSSRRTLPTTTTSGTQIFRITSMCGCVVRCATRTLSFSAQCSCPSTKSL